MKSLVFRNDQKLLDVSHEDMEAIENSFPLLALR